MVKNHHGVVVAVRGTECVFAFGSFGCAFLACFVQVQNLISSFGDLVNGASTPAIAANQTLNHRAPMKLLTDLALIAVVIHLWTPYIDHKMHSKGTVFAKCWQPYL
jgi:hypothetical protein